METSDRAALINELRVTRTAFLDALAGISEAQSKFKPAPDRWSIEECAEHVALVEKGMLKRVTDESAVAERSERPERQEEVRRFTLNRASKRQAPGHVIPSGRFGSLAKALEQFSANRDQTIVYLSDCKDDLHARSIVHPIGPMTCHECFVMIANHPLRHLAQIQEIQAAPGYPA
jgi:hypothetical protein